MMAPIRVLLLEDDPADAELLVRALVRDGPDCEVIRVASGPEFLASLDPHPDVVLTDLALPGYDGLRAFREARERGVDAPFILVSGTVGEEVAAEAIRSGVADYVMKDRPARLGAAVRNAVDAYRENRARELAADALASTERRFHAIVEAASPIFVIDAQGHGIYASTSAAELLGFSPDDVANLSAMTFIHPEDLPIFGACMDSVLSAPGERFVLEEIRARAADGAWHVFRSTVVNLLDDPAVRGIVFNAEDISTTQLAQHELIESERRFRDLTDHMQDVVYRMRVSPEPRMEYMSPSVTKVVGYTPEEFYADPNLLMSVVHPDDRARLASWLASQDAAHAEPNVIRWIRRDGRVVWTEHLGTLSAGSDGALVLEGVGRDVTERVEAQEALRERVNLAEFVTAVSSALARPEAIDVILRRCTNAMVAHLGAAFACIWVLDDEEQVLVLRASSGMYTHLDGSHGRVPVGALKIGRIALEGVPHLTNSVATDTTVDDPEWARREGMVSFAGYPLTIGGRVLGVMAMFARHPLSSAVLDAMGTVATEIAVAIEGRLAAAAAASGERLLDALIEAIPAGVAIAGRGTNVVRTNAAFRAMFDLDDEAVIGRSFLDLADPEDTGLGPTALSAFAADPGFVFHGEVRFATGKGTFLPVLATAALVGGSTETTRFILVAQDISELKRSEAVVARALETERAATASLRAVDAMRETFLTSVSHEIRTPLTSVLGFAETLQERGDRLSAEVRRDMVDRIATNARLLRVMLDDILDVDRMTRGVLEARRSPTDVAARIRPIAQRLRASGRDVVTDDAAVIGSVDPAMVERIIEDLGENARRHTPTDATVWMRATYAPSGIEICVEDDGPGVSDALKSGIFDPFRHGDAVIKHSPGTGLGLALVQGFARLHGGHAWVEDREGGGASFRVLLPDPGVEPGEG